jgi:hypothetical protein
MANASQHPLIGTWRIVEMELWDRDFVDLVEPAYITFSNDGLGEFAFGAVWGGIDCRFTPQGGQFTWLGNDEMDEASGSGAVELKDDGTLAGTIRFHLGDESDFVARRWSDNDLAHIGSH